MINKKVLFYFLLFTGLVANAQENIIFEDFESGTYNNWRVKGNAFGTKPLSVKSIPGYQGDMKAKGKYLVNSHASAPGSQATRDNATGSLTSKEFTVSRKWISLLVNGGSDTKTTAVSLIIEGKAVASLGGFNSNKMGTKSFDTSKYIGKKARIKIVDNNTGGWGNIGVDHIVFTNKKPRDSKTPMNVKPKTQSGRLDVFSPEKQLKGFQLHEDFVIELVASEKDGIINPIDMTFDDAGRLWTQTARMYPLDPAADIKWRELIRLMNNPAAQKKNPEFMRIRRLYEGKTKGEDKVLIIENPTEGSPNIKVFADGLAIPQSVLPYKNGVYVAHGSQMIFLEDTDGDGKADKRETVLDGFGFTDTHTMSHLLVRAPGGWVNFSHGALNKGLVTAVKSGAKQRVDFCKNVRFSLDGTKIELVSTGRDNIWGYQLRSNGQWYGTQANDAGDSILPMEPGTGFSGIGGDMLRSYQPMMPKPHSFRVGGTGISGLAFAEDVRGSFPQDEWKDVAFLANPITNSINCVRIKRRPDGSIEAEHLEDLMRSKDDWFRPVNLEFGPDGCLYIADWYNKIISHNEVDRSHPDRDKKHGRIWRIRHKDQKPRKIPNFYKVPNSELVAYLKSPSLWAKRAAWNQISDRMAIELIPQLIKMAGNKQLDETTRIHALWSIENLKYFDKNLMEKLLRTNHDELRRESVRVLSQLPVGKEEFASLLKPFIAEKNVMVRSQVLRTIENYGKANETLIDILVSFCLPDIAGPIKLGKNYERRFERFLARRALEKYPYELNAYLKSDLAKKQPSDHITWASQALPKENREEVFLTEWGKAKNKKIDETRLLIIARMLQNPKVYAAVKDSFKDVSLVALALKHQAAVQSKEFAILITPAVRKALASANPSEGLDAAVKFKISGLDSELRKIVQSSVSDKLRIKAVKALGLRANQYVDIFRELSVSGKSFELRQAAMLELIKADFSLAENQFEVYLTRLADIDKNVALNQFSGSAAASKLLVNSIDSKKLSSTDFDMSMAERILGFNEQNKTAQELYSTHQKIEIAEAKAFKGKLKKFMKIAGKRGGNPALGKPFFSTLCLSCHSVGNEGAGFAPPLDGSSHREDEALLTAILDPDAAVESSYYLYRLIKKDGSTIEGYREKTDERGTTMRFMGGASVFVPASDIQTGNFVGGRSVMPKGLIDSLSEEQVADILAYIRSLK